MNQSPHLTCAKVLDTMRLSGLTYILTETPYSANLSLKKKFIKEYAPPLPHIDRPLGQDHEAEAESKLVKCTRQLEDMKQLYGGEVDDQAITQKQLDVLYIVEDHVRALSQISFLTKEHESLHA